MPINIFNAISHKITISICLIMVFVCDFRKLQHPNIVRLHDSIQEENFHYLVFDLYVLEKFVILVLWAQPFDSQLNSTFFSHRSE